MERQLYTKPEQHQRKTLEAKRYESGRGDQKQTFVKYLHSEMVYCESCGKDRRTRIERHVELMQDKKQRLVSQQVAPCQMCARRNRDEKTERKVRDLLTVLDSDGRRKARRW